MTVNFRQRNQRGFVGNGCIRGAEVIDGIVFELKTMPRKRHNDAVLSRQFRQHERQLFSDLARTGNESSFLCCHRLRQQRDILLGDSCFLERLGKVIDIVFGVPQCRQFIVERIVTNPH